MEYFFFPFKDIHCRCLIIEDVCPWGLINIDLVGNYHQSFWLTWQWEKKEKNLNSGCKYEENIILPCDRVTLEASCWSDDTNSWLTPHSFPLCFLQTNSMPTWLWRCKTWRAPPSPCVETSHAGSRTSCCEFHMLPHLPRTLSHIFFRWWSRRLLFWWISTLASVQLHWWCVTHSRFWNFSLWLSMYYGPKHAPSWEQKKKQKTN